MTPFKKMRTRFAPSPTGELHIGGARSALYGYLFAKAQHGEWLLRIEDTDRERYHEGSIETIQEGLRWLGLTWDGEMMIQSHRTQEYQKIADQLLNSGKAYRCFCTGEELKEMRDQQTAQRLAPKYDRRCLRLSSKEAEKKLSSKQPFVVRMKIPDDGGTNFKDLIRGKVHFNHRDLDDQVLLKSDGFPTYHLANVVDDHACEISHVIRGEEWLPSTPKHLLLYQALGWSVPEFAHLPLILNSNRSKMSKRKDGELVWLSTYRKWGYLPEAMVNFLALLGWNPKNDRETFSLNELIKLFKLEQVHKSGAVFSKERLDHMNAEYIRRLTIPKLSDLARPFYHQEGIADKAPKEFFEAVVGLEQERIKTLSELPPLTRYFFSDSLELDLNALVWRKSNAETTKIILSRLIKYLETIAPANWTIKFLEENILPWIHGQSWDHGSVLWPMRYALSGAQKSPSPFEIAGVLGKEKTLQRLQNAQKML